MRTSPSSAITRLQALLAIDLIIVAFAFGGYLYIGTSAKPAEFEVTGLTIIPEEANLNEPVTISTIVNNTGGEAGSYSVDLTINGVVEEARTVELTAGASTLVTFTVLKQEYGSYSVEIGSLTGTFEIQPSAEFTMTNLIVSPDKVRIGEPVTISAIVTNIGEAAGSYSVDLKINGVVEGTETVELLGWASTTVVFTVAKGEHGNYSVEIGDLADTFEILPPPKPAEFTVTNLAISPAKVDVNQPVTISAIVTNIGEAAGSYSVDLKINGVVEGTETVELLGWASTTVVFTVAKGEHGNYSVEIDGLDGTFEVMAAPPPPKPAEFKVTDLVISPTEVGIGEPVMVSIRLTNVGEEVGSYSVDLKINGTSEETKTVELSGGVSTIVTFAVTKGEYGTYSVEIDDLAGTFEIPPPPPKPALFAVYELVFSPDEAWVGEPIEISVKVRNVGEEAGNISLDFVINDVVRETKIVQVPAGALEIVEFTVTESSEGDYSVEVWDNVGTYPRARGMYTIVPNGTHTLIISASYSGLEFTLDGQSHTTPYSAILNVGTHTITVPMTDTTGVYLFEQWEDGSTNPTRTISLTSRMSITASYSGGSSCPSLYIWNGTSYVYVTEVSNHGWLGYINYINEDGSIVFWRNDPWDYLKLDKSQLQLKNNTYYDLRLTQKWDEIFYLDAAYMLVVDHPSNVNVYSTGVEQYIDPNFMGQIYTVSKDSLTPISAVNEKGEDVLPKISKIDGIFTSGINGINSPSWDNITWNRLTLDLGDLSNAEQIKLVVTGKVDWGSADDYNTWIDSFFAQPVPNGTQITPPPYMEVRDANGNWIRVPESRQFPIPPDVNPRTWVIDLTNLFPKNDYSLRINNFWNVTFDYIGVDTTSQTDLTIQRVDPQASLYQVFTTYSKSEGNFTRYGDVTQLVLDADDKFVIGRQGDEVSLKFPSANIAPPPESMERDIFLFVSGWFKDKYGNWGFGFGFTVDPLPFQDMSGFPYPLTESYPYDADHLSYLLEYNTRTINP